MAVLQLLKRSNVTTAVPTTTQLSLGELAVNTFDGRLFSKKNNGTDSITEFLSTTGNFIGTIDTLPIGRGFGGFAGNIRIGIGAFSGNTLSGALDNIAIGTNAMKNNIRSSNNIAIGTGAAQNTNILGSGNNVAIGISALNLNVSGQSNVAIGTNSLLNNNANNNIGIGFGALRGNINGTNNLAIGSSTLLVNLNANSCIAIGNSALTNLTGGNGSNVAIGTSALGQMTNGFNNVGVGNNALAGSRGNNSVAMGIAAGNNATIGNGNIFVGFNCLALAPTDNNTIVIGTSVVGSGSNTTTIGNSTIIKTKLWGALSLDGSIITTPATTFTINKSAGIITCALADTIIVTNSFVTNTSIVSVQLRNIPSPTLAMITNIVVSNGSFTITFGATPVTTNPIISFIVIQTT